MPLIRFQRPFVRLPIRFSAEALAAEVAALPPSAWVSHPDGYKGNNAVRLISPGGQETDKFAGPMAPTPHLRRCPYIVEVMSELGGVWGRSRLMGLAAGAEVPPHVDSHRHWQTHIRIHIPIITSPAVEFTCGGETVHMAPGECWTFDSFRFHEVHNRGSEHRVHLVLDTVGGPRLFDLLEQAQAEPDAPAREFLPGSGKGEPIRFERINVPVVMSPWEMRCHVELLMDETIPHPLADTVFHRIERFMQEWGALWAEYGPADPGVPHYQQLLIATGRDLDALGGAEIQMENGLPLYHVLDRLVFESAIMGTPTTFSRAAA